MKVQKFLDNVSNFIIHPSDKRYKPCTRRFAWSVTVVMLFATFGITHGLCLLWIKLRKIPLKPQHEKIQGLFTNNYPAPKKQPAPSPEPIVTPPPIVAPPPNPPNTLSINSLSHEDMVAMNDFIKLHHNERTLQFSIKALGEDWCIWFDESLQTISLQKKIAFDKNSDYCKIDLQISKNDKQISVSNNMQIFFEDDYPTLLLTLHHEVSSLRFLADNAPEVDEPVIVPKNPPNIFGRNPPEVVNPVIFPDDSDSSDFDEPFKPIIIEKPKPIEPDPVDFPKKYLIETDQPVPTDDSQDEPCKLSCPADWTLFQFILSQKMMSNVVLDDLGTFAIRQDFQNRMTIIKLGKWNQPLQPPHQLVIELKIDDGGKLCSFIVNKKQLFPMKYIPKEYFSILNGCFKKALETVCDYQDDIVIPTRSLSKIPEFHLRSLYEKLKRHHAFKELIRIRVQFLSVRWDNLIKQNHLIKDEGIDAGGLAKQYIEGIIKNLIDCPELNFVKSRTGLAMPSIKNPFQNAQDELKKTAQALQLENPIAIHPSLSPQENDLYFKLGYLMGCSAITDFVKTGIYFEDAVFRAIFACQSEKIDRPFDNLSQDVLLRMTEAILQSREEMVGNDPVYKLFLCAKLLKEQIKQPLPIHDEDFKKQSAKNDESLKTALENAGVGFLEDMPDDYVDHGLLLIKFDEIKKNKEQFLQALYYSIFNFTDSNYGKIGTQLAPIHAMTRGMQAIFTSFDVKWYSIVGGHKGLSDKIQGTRDRQKIVNKIGIRQFEPTEHLKRTTEWLKEWIKDPTTTDKQIALFLKFTTGLTVMADDTRIEISSKYEIKPTPLPVAHTCSNKLDLSDEPSILKSKKSKNSKDADSDEVVYSDATKEGFIKILTELVLQEENMQFYMK